MTLLILSVLLTGALPVVLSRFGHVPVTNPFRKII